MMQLRVMLDVASKFVDLNLRLMWCWWFAIWFNLNVQAVVQAANISPNEVGDIVVGTVLAPGSQRAIECRMAAFYAGFPGLIYYIIYLQFGWFILFH